MNYDLAIMALEGLVKTPIDVTVSDDLVTIHGTTSGFKELARLCLLLGSADVSEGEGFELNPAAHLSADSSSLHLRLRNQK
ncbi:MAG TPA: hypothetical protein VNM92_04710 [Thermoanaerobaculia bacterium]|nr:hypothetical protein [Thermoanaerobaculia bacterium]